MYALGKIDITWKSESEGLLIRLPMESASENAELEISETLLLLE